MPNYSMLFALAAILLAMARYTTYIYTIYQGKTKPHAFSWLLWAAVGGIGAAAQFELHAGPSVLALGFVAVACFLISLSVFFISGVSYKRSDWAALIVCLLTIPVWQATHNPLFALGLMMLIDIFTYWPTVRKSYNKPDTEPPISYGLAGLRSLLILFAIPHPNWRNVMYPLFLMSVDWLFALYIVLRRWNLGLPLHEYSAIKEDK